MALIKCRECGRDISDQATACPHCGAPLAATQAGNATRVEVVQKRSGCGTLLLIGVAVLALLYFIGRCSPGTTDGATSAAPTSAAVEPATAGSVRIISESCAASREGTRYEVTVQNDGAATIAFAKLFVDFLDGASVISADTYFSPSDIPPGARASADVYRPTGSGARCRLATVQASGGAAVALHR